MDKVGNSPSLRITRSLTPGRWTPGRRCQVVGLQVTSARSLAEGSLIASSPGR
ncbi:UNVERIFIED_CONTAM: hypothetical protein Sradi_5722800 [Sesamum radiatum]|uniref:Uncharacterized protein n=1 Tax=Sesamum radiatum TaxID=300843 RepID=A0AAW2L1V7_SESRA